ncbi:MAG: efflux RND transporter permease subunit [Gammaproteobacteria bacterium]|nr:efflux RND transporter permease subunit [Gammaproteobacteria bacterium]
MGTESIAPSAPQPSATAEKSGIIHLFARHPVAANLLMAILIILGSYSLIKLNRQFFPNFALDYITVRVVWPGASAEDVEQSITVPMEQALRTVDGAKEMTSTSTRGMSLVVIEFEEGSEMGVALDDVKQFVSNVRHLPSDSEDPEVKKVSRYEPVATVILTAEGELEELRPLAYEFERQLLDKGIARVSFSGMPEQEIAIEVSAKKLQQLGLSLPQIGERIVSQSQDIPAGTVAENEAAREVRGLQRKRDVQQFARLDLLTDRSGQKLTLDDIAEIQRRPKESQVEIFYQGNPAILMNLQRTENADALKSAEIMDAWLAQTRTTLSPAVKLVVFDEAYSLIQQRISLLLKNGVSGLILVLIILYIFLNGRVAFWVAVGIPTSFLGALAVLYFTGGTINMISLFALIMALGIIVDDAIVVAEDALTHYQYGENSLLAAEGGAMRMLAPVMSSSLTTVAAFFPLMLVTGIIGSILFDIPFVVICVIIASLFESFLILPGHLRTSFHKNHHKKNSKVRQKLEDGFNNFRDNYFRPLMIRVIDNRMATLTIALCALVLAVSLVIFGQLKFHFFPQPESTVINASVKFSAGTPPEQVRAFAQQMEQTLQQTDAALKQDSSLIKAAVLQVNTASFDGGRNFQTGNQYAMLKVELLQPDERDVRNTAIIEEWESRIELPPGVEQFSINSPRGGPPGLDIDVFFSGQDAITLKHAAEELTTALKSYHGVSNILDDLPYGRQQYIFKLTPLAQSAGLTIAEVGRQLRAALDGQLLQIFYDSDEEIEVRIMLPANERKFQGILDTLPIITPAGQPVLLSNAVKLSSQQGLEILRHTDARMGVHVTAEVDAKVSNAKEVLAGLQQSVIPDIVDKYSLQVSYKGRAEEERETSSDMKHGGMLALVMIYIILAWVFASYIWPLAVMIIIPFGICGALFGHWLMGIDLTILSQFGMFGLSGIVINDSIILVTFYKQLRAKGMAVREALIESSCLRLRAVLLTSLTTIAGLTPLLFETSLQAQFLIPMATSISFGLAFTTMLVLFVVPVLLSYIEQLAEFLLHKHISENAEI